MFSSIATAPAKQSVSETISVYSGRLGSAVLLEDRRAAIVGLRSFAKQYPASVASGALRSLIGSLSKDGEDVDTVKLVLETLLMLFNPNEDSPEASEEIALWLADEFTQRQENITLLLDFLDTNDFYSRLYSLQLLSAILAARTERTEECVFNARLGISRLVAILDDRREAVRNEAITLLTYLTPTSLEIQKLVAFENAFERVFGIIQAEGGLGEGGQVVEDCLILLANLLRLNSSNQALFRETGCVPRLSKLLESAYVTQDDGDEVAPWAQAQKNRNIYALLAVIRLFLVSGAVGTAQNQASFFQHGLLFHALQLAFGRGAEMPIRSEALVACADIIRGNPNLQESFAQLQVPSPLDVPVEQADSAANGVPKVYVIDGLLDLALSVQALQAFDLRRSACECLKAYFYKHPEVRSHFLRRAIEGHKSGADETANVLTTLLSPPTEVASGDPYRYWFAAVLMLHLIYDNPATKALAMEVSEGDEASGEEVVTGIQTITAHLLGSLSRGDDSRIILGSLMLLLCWLFEDLDAVNDFLGEGSNVQGLVQGAVQNPHGDPLVQGLCAMLLGVVYEFSTKDSPIPRSTLQTILTSGMGRDRYIEKLSKVRSHPFIRDFEVMPQKLDLSAGQKLPDVFFDATFVDFFKDNYSRILRAVDREPGLEISVVTNGVEKGISREMVDTLRAQVEEKERALQDVQAELSSLSRQLGQEQADHRRTKESAELEASRVKSVNEGLQRHHEEEIRKLQQEREAEMRRLQQQNRLKEEEFGRQSEAARRQAQSEAERVQRRAEAEKADLKATISRLEVDLMKASKSKAQELQELRDQHKAQLSEQTTLLKKVEERVAAIDEKLQRAEGRCQELEQRLKQSDDEIQKLDGHLKDKETEKETVQSELDDLLMVYSDLEEKAKQYRID
ncbi:p115 like vesicle tethering protein [Coniochaeta sp. 2T2.1]|nr:p115 like vesicle tethering protein [Coniochaeta sp. 2T2.1]